MKNLFHFCKCVFLTSTMAEQQREVLVTADKRHQMKPRSHWKSSILKEVNVCDWQRHTTVGFGAQEVCTATAQAPALCRPQSCYAPFQSSCCINKMRHSQRAAPRAAMPSKIFHLWFLPPENVSDSQQGGLTEQPKNSCWVISTNWEEEKSNFKVA